MDHHEIKTLQEAWLEAKKLGCVDAKDNAKTTNLDDWINDCSPEALSLPVYAKPLASGVEVWRRESKDGWIVGAEPLVTFIAANDND